MDRTIETLCRLPVDFRALGTLSPMDLVARSGYGQVADHVLDLASPFEQGGAPKRCGYD